MWLLVAHWRALAWLELGFLVFFFTVRQVAFKLLLPKFAAAVLTHATIVLRLTVLIVRAHSHASAARTRRLTKSLSQLHALHFPLGYRPFRFSGWFFSGRWLLFLSPIALIFQTFARCVRGFSLLFHIESLTFLNKNFLANF